MLRILPSIFIFIRNEEQKRNGGNLKSNAEYTRIEE
jgi:hypothetical protein